MSHVSPAVRLGASLWLGLLAGIAQAQSPTVNPSDGCPPTSAAKKNFGAGLLSALNSGANAIRQAASGLSGGPQQTANTANQVAGAAASTSGSSNCSGAASSTSTATATSSSAMTASPSNAAGSATTPTRMADASATSVAWTPPGDTPAAPAGPPDFAKLPQITGLGIGLSVDEALANMQKLHPGKHVNQGHNGPDVRHSFVETLGVVAPDGSGYMTRVDLTGPPEAQAARHVGRQLAQPHVARTVVLAALRQKYGHETVAIGHSDTVPETSDDKIIFAWWVYDEQGHLLTSTKLLAASPYGCAGSAPDMSSEYNYMGVVGNLSGMTPTGWCAASFVAMKANLGSQPITDSVLLDLVDTPLLVRSALATGAWVRGMQNQAQQQQIQRSSQVKPQL
jgi:hypothetical protein